MPAQAFEALAELALLGADATTLISEEQDLLELDLSVEAMQALEELGETALERAVDRWALALRQTEEVNVPGRLLQMVACVIPPAPRHAERPAFSRPQLAILQLVAECSRFWAPETYILRAHSPGHELTRAVSARECRSYLFTQFHGLPATRERLRVVLNQFDPNFPLSATDSPS